MTPHGKIQSVIELVEAILTKTHKPADIIMQAYFRKSRFIGSSDRRAIGNRTFAILRYYHGLSATFTNATPRLLVFLYLIHHENFTLKQLEDLATPPYGPTPLTMLEKKLLQDVKIYEPNLLPDWLLEYIPSDCVLDLFKPAPVDVRVNTLKSSFEKAFAELKKEDFDAMPTKLSPIGIRFEKRLPLNTHPLWKDGILEVQEEASQIAALLCDAKPHMRVLDYCAGAGGKSLALAAAMQNKGQLVLSDTSTFRLDRAKQRLRRAGVSNYQIKNISDDLTWFKRQHNKFDRVFVDAPCSGTGNWRRNPDLKIRFSQIDLEEITRIQKDILEKVSPLVKPGGRLIYATCSFLKAENNDQIDAFLKNHTDFNLLPIQTVWQETLKTACPFTEPWGQFLTHIHDTDGFFISILEKTTLNKKEA